MTSPSTPPRLYPPGGLQMAVKITYSGQDALCVVGATGPSAVPTQEVATAWRDLFWSSFSPLMAGAATCTGAIVRQVDGPDGVVVEVGPPAVPGGGGGQGGVLLAACTLIKWSTTRGGRSGKGRLFLPAVPGSFISGDGRTYLAAAQSAVATAVNAYIANDGPASALVNPSVLSFTKGVASPITAGSLAAVVGVQRRRMR